MPRAGPRRSSRLDRDDDPVQAVFDLIKGSSPAVRRMIAMARKVAASPSAVLIRGESGTGKELLAAAIHAAGERADRPFVKVHCAALSQNLLESELFGHVQGAFTGADRDRMGRFEQANGGTLFLDEIGDINLEVQTKLLRVLQEMSFERVGSSQPVTVDVRIMAATHQDLEALIEAGRFREDLYYRLNVICLQTPPLRQRREDIFELAVFFLDRHASRSGKVLTHIEPEAVEAADGPRLAGQHPRARERPRAGRRAGRRPRAVRPRLAPRGAPACAAEAPASGAGCRDPPGPRGVGDSWLPPRPGAAPAILDARARGGTVGRADRRTGGDGNEWNAEYLEFERQRLLDALNESGGNKSVAARLLGMPRSTFFSKLRKHGIA